jgi:hypothetical protein
MSLEPDAETEDPGWERPVVLPMYQFPSRIATRVAWALVASATFTVIAGLVTAVSYRQALPPGESLPPGLRISQPSIGIADRVSLFANGSGSLTVALLVVIALVVVGMSTRQDEVRSAVRRRRPLLVATCGIGIVVLLANVAKAIVILGNVTGSFTAELSTNKISNLLALLPPVLSVAGALTYAVSRLKNTPESPSVGDTQPPAPTDT